MPVDLAMSIAVYDDELQQQVEPGTPTTAARLATVRAIRDAGLECSVFLMPVLPFITDTRAHLDQAIGRAADAGASSVMYSALHLRPGVKPWWAAWLQRTRPDLVARYRSMYLDNTYAPADYRRWLADRVRPILAAHGLGLGRVDPTTGSMGFSDRQAHLVPDGAVSAAASGRPSGVTGARITNGYRVPVSLDEQSRPTSSPLKRADPGFDRRGAAVAAVGSGTGPTLF